MWVPHKMLAKKDIVAARLLRLTQKIVSLRKQEQINNLSRLFKKGLLTVTDEIGEKQCHCVVNFSAFFTKIFFFALTNSKFVHCYPARKTWI